MRGHDHQITLGFFDGFQHFLVDFAKGQMLFYLDICRHVIRFTS